MTSQKNNNRVRAPPLQLLWGSQSASRRLPVTRTAVPNPTRWQLQRIRAAPAATRRSPQQKKRKSAKNAKKKKASGLKTLATTAERWPSVPSHILRRREPSARRERATDTTRRREVPAALKSSSTSAGGQQQPLKGQRLRGARDDRRWAVEFRRIRELMGAKPTRAKRRSWRP